MKKDKLTIDDPYIKYIFEFENDEREYFPPVNEKSIFSYNKKNNDYLNDEKPIINDRFCLISDYLMTLSKQMLCMIILIKSLLIEI